MTSRYQAKNEGLALHEKILPTTVIGSYPQPDWLIDRQKLSKTVPRVRSTDLWRIQAPYLEEAQDDATIVAIRDMERAGIDIITDGEMRRESYSNRFATALEGVDIENPGRIVDRYGQETLVPRIVGKIRRQRPVEVADMEFLRRNTDRTAKITLPGPFTMAQQALDEHYGDPEALTMDFADAVNEEARDLEAAGADIIQIDEPWLRNDPDAADRYAVQAIDRAFRGITVTTAIHLCFGYAAMVNQQKPTGYAYLPQLADCMAQQISIESAQPKIDLSVLESLSGKSIILGVIDLSDPKVESPDEIARRIRAGLQHVAPDHLIPAPDCGMKYLPREVAFGKLVSLVEGAAIVRREL